MFVPRKRYGAALVALLAVTAVAPRVHAQYPPYGYGYGYPRIPAYGPAARGYGTGQALQGQAAAMQAQSGLLTSSEQARILREQANQAKLETKKQTLDWQNYERANTPTFTDNQEREKGLLLRRMMNNPVESEIVYGQVQNALLPFLNGLASQGIQGPSVSLDPELLKQVNVVGGGSGSVGSVGMLKAGGQVDWPLPVLGPTQERVASLLPLVVSQTAQNKIDPKLYKQVRDGVTKMLADLRGQFLKEQIDGGTYLTGKRFLDSLEKSVNALQQPGAYRQFDGSNAASGRTVQELVQNMSSKGLKFAPCSPGGEQAYHALYSAMASYAAGAQNDSGFRVQMTNQLPAPKRNPF